MKQRDTLLGLAAGFSAGYCAYRTVQAARGLRREHSRAERDAKRYGAQRRALTVATIARSLALNAAVAYSGIPEFIDARLRTRVQVFRPLTFTAATTLLESILELPVAYVEDYRLERSYGMTDQPAAAWLTDRAKETAIGMAVSSLLAAGFAEVARRAPRTWPLYASVLALPLFIAANIVVPLYIMPLFNKFEPLTGELEPRLRALAGRYGVGDAEILRVDMSRQTKKANAYVTGIGSTHRIVIGDTLLENFTPDEVEFVVAHELGHYVAKDSWRLIAAGEALTIVVAFAAARIVGPSLPATGHPKALVRLSLWATLLSQLLRPALGAFSRSREWAADRFATSATQAPLTGAAAFRRLRDQNLAEDEQPAWFEFVFSTHPSLRARIAALEAAG